MMPAVALPLSSLSREQMIGGSLTLLGNTIGTPW
jgi:hypothetical protein